MMINKDGRGKAEVTKRVLHMRKLEGGLKALVDGMNLSVECVGNLNDGVQVPALIYVLALLISIG